MIRRSVQPVQWALAMLAMAVSCDAAALTIDNVQASPAVIEHPTDQSLLVRYELSGEARVVLRIYDDRDRLVAEVAGDGVEKPGPHERRWSVRDQRGRVVPADAYRFALEANARNGESVVYDPSDVTGGRAIVGVAPKVDAASGEVSYVLTQSARVRVRLGIAAGGPLMRTLVNFAPRAAGAHRERWDGLDASGLVTLKAHPALSLGVDAFSLSANTFIVGAPQAAPQFIGDLRSSDTDRRPATLAAKQMYAHAQQPAETRGDYQLDVSLPSARSPASNGLPLVTHATAVRVDVQPQDRERALERRFETVFFVDGRYVFENELGFLPMSWNLDPAGMNPGEHFVTVNLRGYEGNFGVATVKFWVPSPRDGVKP